MNTTNAEQAGPARSKRIRAILRLGVMAAIAVGVLAALRVTPLGELLVEENIQAMLDAVGPGAAPAFVVLYAVLIALWVPGTIMTVAGAAIFPTGLAIILNYAGAVCGSALGFVIARRLGGDALDATFGDRSPLYARYRGAMETRGFETILYLRLIPTPYNALSWLAGMSPMSLARFTAATAIGIVPGSVAITYLADAFADAFFAGDWSAFVSVRTLSAMALFAGVAAIPTAIRVARERWSWFGGIPDPPTQSADEDGDDPDPPADQAVLPGD